MIYNVGAISYTDINKQTDFCTKECVFLYRKGTLCFQRECVRRGWCNRSIRKTLVFCALFLDKFKTGRNNTISARGAQDVLFVDGSFVAALSASGSCVNKAI